MITILVDFLSSILFGTDFASLESWQVSITILVASGLTLSFIKLFWDSIKNFFNMFRR